MSTFPNDASAHREVTAHPFRERQRASFETAKVAGAAAAASVDMVEISVESGGSSSSSTRWHHPPKTISVTSSIPVAVRRSVHGRPPAGVFPLLRASECDWFKVVCSFLSVQERMNLGLTCGQLRYVVRSRVGGLSSEEVRDWKQVRIMLRSFRGYVVRLREAFQALRARHFQQAFRRLREAVNHRGRRVANAMADGFRRQRLRETWDRLRSRGQVRGLFGQWRNSVFPEGMPSSRENSPTNRGSERLTDPSPSHTSLHDPSLRDGSSPGGGGGTPPTSPGGGTSSSGDEADYGSPFSGACDEPMATVPEDRARVPDAQALNERRQC